MYRIISMLKSHAETKLPKSSKIVCFLPVKLFSQVASLYWYLCQSFQDTNWWSYFKIEIPKQWRSKYRVQQVHAAAQYWADSDITQEVGGSSHDPSRIWTVSNKHSHSEWILMKKSLATTFTQFIIGVSFLHRLKMWWQHEQNDSKSFLCSYSWCRLHIPVHLPM